MDQLEVKKSRDTVPLSFYVKSSPKSLGSDLIQVQNTVFHTVYLYPRYVVF
jgi:hypothetical protein